ncbi:putative permease [Cladobotryum mycophilum]|uniref:Permease n=1 Tax=Cladobotryum mycophilum TaxID=491253 RepID=A0ABR0SN35_9HYPO
MSEAIQKRYASLKQEIGNKTTVDGWILPKQESSWAPPGTWTNIDLDVTPPERRTWTSWTMLGYWVSDVITIQSWETGSTILAVGLTWREAVLSIILGSCVMAIPLAMNGYIGAKTHIPFPVLARASFGYRFANFPIILRLFTCLFWFAITNYLAIAPTTQVIRAIWPSYRNVPNHIPESVGITTQQMISYFVIWTIQFPLLLVPPYKIKWLFLAKFVMVTATVAGMVIWICVQAGSSGDIWTQEASVTGSKKSWLVMWSINSCTAAWSTMGVNIPDFTRYMRSPKASLSQGIWFPLVCSWIAIIGIVVTSTSGVLYGKHIWDPVSIIDRWEGPAGRAAAFFAGLSWCLAQICVNISGAVINGANDMASLSPKWINIKRGAIIIAFIGGWALTPWKILHSASSLLSFMNSLGIFMTPIVGIQVADFFVVKRQALDIPALYQPEGRYSYWYGVNWRALAALIATVAPTLPGLINAVNPDIPIGGTAYLANFNWYYGFVTSFIVYSRLSLLVPAKETLVPRMRHTPEELLEEGDTATPSEKAGHLTPALSPASGDPFEFAVTLVTYHDKHTGTVRRGFGSGDSQVQR